MKRRKVVIISSISAACVALLSALGIFIGFTIANNNKANAYDEGVQNLVDAKYVDAYQIFTALGSYKDSPKKKSYSYELFNIQEGYKNYEKSIDSIIKSEGVSFVNFDTDGGNPLPSRKIDQASTTSYITERGFKSYMDFDYWRIDEAHYDKDNDDVNLTLLAVYYKHQYKIAYELNGGSISKDAPLHYTYFDGDTMIPYPSRDGYNFVGYKVNGGGDVIKDVVIPSHSHIDYTLSAVYEEKTIHVTFNANGGSVTPTSGDYIYDHDYSATFPVATKDYYTFAGWYYNDILVTPNKFNVSDDNAELIASYLPADYTITYNLDGGSFLTEVPHAYNIETPTFSIPYPHKDGYLFTGWTIGSEIATISYQITQGSHDNITLNAHYVEYTRNDQNLITGTGSDIHSYTDVVLPSDIVGIGSTALHDDFNEILNFGMEEGSGFYYEDHFLIKKTNEGTELYWPCYAYYKDATSITIPYVNKVGTAAFSNNTKLESIVLSPITTVIGDSAFYKCTNLSSVTGGNITKVETRGFSECESLPYSVIESYVNLSYIGDNAFRDCDLFDNINITQKIKYVGDMAFGMNDSITNVTIDYASDANISLTAFNGASSLDTIHIYTAQSDKVLELFDVIKSQIKHIELIGGGGLTKEGLRGYNELLDVTFTDTSFNVIPEEYCRSTTKLGSITIPDTVTSIEKEAFRDSGVTSVTFADASKIKLIATGAFRNTKITSIDLHEANDITIEDDAFLDCKDLETIHIHYDAVSNLGKVFRRCGNMKDIYIYYAGNDGDSINIEQEYFSEFRQVEHIYFVNITDRVINISFGASCFKNCESLESITFDNFKLVGLSNYTFENCKSLDFDPADHVFDNITALPEGVFYGCESLTGISFNNITSIGREAFVNCLSLGVSSHIYLPHTINEIGYQAFAFTSPSSHIDVEESSTASYAKWDANWNKNFYGVLLYEVAA